MRLIPLMASRRAGMVAMVYALIFVTVLGLSLRLPDNDLLGTLAILLTYPWSILIFFVGAWSIAHSGYPIQLYFLPGAIINLVALYLLCKISEPRRKNPARSA
jgi:asparagine N-glycosylation enzyme membrane subunit Stt3